MKIVVRGLLGLLLACLLAGCGGGGSSGSTTPAPTPPTVEPEPPPATGEDPCAGSSACGTPTIEARFLGDGFPVTVRFEGLSGSGSVLASFSWDFGDGSTAQGSVVEHEYVQAGIYEVRLEVIGEDGAMESTTDSIRVRGRSLAGILHTQATSTIDVDTNSPTSRLGDNDSFESAQRVRNPVIVGGYVADRNVGRDGPLLEDGDPADFYRFTALGGEVITLQIAESSADLDLLLYDAAGTLVADSRGTGSIERVGPLTASGDYVIEVRELFRSASNYQIRIATDLRAVLLPSVSTFDDFVTGDLVTGPRLAPLSETGAYEGLETLARSRSGSRLVRSERGGFTASSAAATDRVKGEDGDQLETIMALKRLQRSGRFRWVERNHRLKPLLDAPDRLFPRQWNLAHILAPSAWEITRGSPDVLVGVIDSGILEDHPDFSGQLVDGFDFVSDPEFSGDGDGIDPDPRDPAPNGISHGSHVAGIVGARTGDTSVPEGGGMAGVGWDTRIMPLRILGSEGGTSFDLREAIRYAAGLPNASEQVPDRPVDIINLSLGSSSFSEATQALIAEVRARGIVFVAAAGNSGSSEPAFPAAYDGVVSVTASDINDQPTDYANFGATIDVVAPGGDRTTDLDGDGIEDGILSVSTGAGGQGAGYEVLSGTSMAAPHVSGVIALMKAVHPGLTPDDVDVLLKGGRMSTPLMVPGRESDYGAGFISAIASVRAAAELAGSQFDLPPVLAVQPQQLFITELENAESFRLVNIGGGELQVLSITSDVPWLSAVPVSRAPDSGLGTYEAVIDRATLPEAGTERGTLTIRSTATDTTLGVQVEVFREDPSAEVGRVRVHLVRADGNAVYEQSVALEIDRGDYFYEFTDIADGDYVLVASTDMDNDGEICDAGEACAAYPSFSLREPVTFDQDLDGLEFVVSFRSIIDLSAVDRF